MRAALTTSSWCWLRRRSSHTCSAADIAFCSTTAGGGANDTSISRIGVGSLWPPGAKQRAAAAPNVMLFFVDSANAVSLMIASTRMVDGPAQLGEAPRLPYRSACTAPLRRLNYHAKGSSGAGFVIPFLTSEMRRYVQVLR